MIERDREMRSDNRKVPKKACSRLLQKKLLLLSFLSVTDLSAAKRVFEYDAVGNMLTRDAQQTSYNSQNKLVGVSGDNGVGDYVYKDSGSRIRKRFSLTADPGHSTELLNPSKLLTLQEKRSVNRGAVNHIYVNGVRLAALTTDTHGNPAIRYYHTDQVSSVKLVTDGKVDALARHEYKPYGEEFKSPTSSSVGSAVNPLPKFNSQELDKESGLNFFNARHYDSKLAHFVSPDTVIDGEGGGPGWNRYMYAHGNPIKYADPSGHLIVVYDRQGTRYEDFDAIDFLESKYGKFYSRKNVQSDFNVNFLKKLNNSKTEFRIRLTGCPLYRTSESGWGAIAKADVVKEANGAMGIHIYENELKREYNAARRKPMSTPPPAMAVNRTIFGGLYLAWDSSTGAEPSSPKEYIQQHLRRAIVEKMHFAGIREKRSTAIDGRLIEIPDPILHTARSKPVQEYMYRRFHKSSKYPKKNYEEFTEFSDRAVNSMYQYVMEHLPDNDITHLGYDFSEEKYRTILIPGMLGPSWSNNATGWSYQGYLEKYPRIPLSCSVCNIL